VYELLNFAMACSCTNIHSRRGFTDTSMLNTPNRRAIETAADQSLLVESWGESSLVFMTRFCCQTFRHTAFVNARKCLRIHFSLGR